MGRKPKGDRQFKADKIEAEMRTQGKSYADYQREKTLAAVPPIDPELLALAESQEKNEPDQPAITGGSSGASAVAAQAQQSPAGSTTRLFINNITAVAKRHNCLLADLAKHGDVPDEMIFGESDAAITLDQAVMLASIFEDYDLQKLLDPKLQINLQLEDVICQIDALTQRKLYLESQLRTDPVEVQHGRLDV